MAIALTSSSASAQAISTSASPPGQGADVGEIVVTAQKREQRQSDVPSTVNVVTGAQILAAGPITNTADIVSTVPGVRFNNLQSPLLSEISIRGSGTERATGADPSVGLFANGVYVGGGGSYGRNLSPIDSFDLDRAEVLEGPQGALYGRNAEYGVVNLVSQQPLFKDTGYLDNVYTIQTGNDRETAVFNHPLSDTLAMRVGIQAIEQSGGFEYNADEHKYYDATTGWMGRAQLRYKAGGWDVDLIAETQQLQIPSYDASANIPAGKIATYPLGYFQPRYNIPIAGDESAAEDVTSVVLLANYDLGWGLLSSTSSYRQRNATQNRATSDNATEAALQALGEKGAWPLTQVNNQDDTTMLYQDLHLGGSSWHDRLTWLGGAEFLQYDNRGVSSTTTNPCATQAQPNPVVGAGICGGTPADHVCYELLPTSTVCPTVYPSPFGSNTLTHYLYRSAAAYGSLAFKIGWGFTLSGDVRYTDDDKTAHENVYELYTTTPYPYLTGGVIPATNYSLQKSIVTYTTTLSYKLPATWDGLVYAKYGTGYRAGGFNFGTTPVVKPFPGYAPVLPTYGDETTSSYEVGFKGKITRAVYFTIDAYNSITNNALASVADGCTATNACEVGNTAYTVNAGTVHGSGIEAEADTSLRLLEGLLALQVTGSDQVAKYYSVPTTRPGLAAGQATGLPLVDTAVAQNPHWLASVTANYSHQIVGNLDGFANVVAHGQWGGVQDPIVTGLPANDLSNFVDVDLRAGVDYKALELAFVVTDLTNETHILLQNQQNGPVNTQARWSLPRTVGVEAKYKW